MSLTVALRVWMRETLEVRNISAEQWATQAGTSATNITRFLAGSDHVPSLKTVAKLAAISGTWPALGSGNRALAVSERLVPLVEPSNLCAALQGGASRTGWVGSMGGAGQSATAFAASASMRLTGSVTSGDVLILEPLAFRRMHRGSLVVAQDEEGLIVGRFFPPFIMGGEAPIADLDGAEVLGVVIELRRVFA
jgi:hypothetical protein